jgi:hypothetical protein
MVKNKFPFDPNILFIWTEHPLLIFSGSAPDCAWLLDYKIKNDYNKFVQVLHGANFILQERVCIAICSMSCMLYWMYVIICNAA